VAAGVAKNKKSLVARNVMRMLLLAY